MKRNGIGCVLGQRPVMLGLWVVAALFLGACGALPQSTWPGITTTGDQAYLTNGAQLFALDVNTGTVDWVFPDKPDRKAKLFPEPAVSGDLVVLTSYQNMVYVLNDDGQQRWATEVAHSQLIAPAAIGDEAVYIASTDSVLYALDIDTGSQLWAFEGSEKALWGAPLLADEVLYLPSLDHHLYALDAQTGDALWSTALDGGLVETPLVVDGVLYTGSLSNHAYALDAQTGEIVWDFETEQGWAWGTPTVADGVAYFGDMEGNVYAVDDAGEQLWRVQFDSAVRPTPLLDDEALYIVEEAGWLRALARSDGDELWSVEVEKENDDHLLGQPQLVGDLIILSPLNANIVRVYAYDRSNGRQEWSFDANEHE